MVVSLLYGNASGRGASSLSREGGRAKENWFQPAGADGLLGNTRTERITPDIKLWVYSFGLGHIGGP
jgi:hypothetical protein